MNETSFFFVFALSALKDFINSKVNQKHRTEKQNEHGTANFFSYIFAPFIRLLIRADLGGFFFVCLFF